MFSKIYSAFPYGLEARIVEVETELEPGLRAFHIIGLPDEAVKEAAKRVSAALRHSGFKSPNQMNKKITVNLAPADLKKQGSFFDVAIAVGFLCSSNQISFSSENISFRSEAEKQTCLFLGELSLEGEVRPLSGILGIALYAKLKGFSSIYVPYENALEASLVKGIEVVGIKRLSELGAVLRKEISAPFPEKKIMYREIRAEYDLGDIHGQEYAKRALEIAAAGGHHLFMIGPPGAGKSILAKAFPSLLPPLSEEEGLEVATIYSSRAPLTSDPSQSRYSFFRPFRSPHHTASAQAILGGGNPLGPGEITFAHRGVLFLDEFPEFRRDVLEGLRQPLEEKIVKISRSNDRFIWPAHFQLIAASNPCPCGFKNDPKEPCICSPGAINRYERKFSGPLMDRIDLNVFVPRLSKEEILQPGGGAKTSSQIREKVKKARAIQAKRFDAAKTNSGMSLKEIKKFASINQNCKTFLGKAIEQFNLSMRSYHKILKLSRTISDLEETEEIKERHIAEALQYNRNKVVT